MILNKITDIEGLMYFFRVDNLYLAGQPSVESLEQLKDFNFTKFINLRSSDEGDFSFEEEFCKSHNIEYYHFPIMVDGVLDKEACKKLSELVDSDKNYFIHCASANRVGGWLITYLVQYKNMDFEQAMQIAMQSGLTNPGLIQAAQMVLD
ncbi:MAG: hypothetical protein N4A33_02360 [Bacteriovoracaceae bacterium]|jgi:protein tyrosine phosphatase (PTP) superfamily phosphohydrolase (DUF442 family)|nr:hypothetical protein [Bacteriovoracaceae bacterium]